MTENRPAASLAGLYQTVALGVYVAIISGVLRYVENVVDKPAGAVGMMLLLFLIVVSAAITSLSIFGYPVYLSIHNKVKEGLAVLGYTFIYSVFVVILILFALKF